MDAILKRRGFLMQAGGLILATSTGAFYGCSGGGGDDTSSRSEPYDIPSVGILPAVSSQSASVPTGGGQVELSGVASLSIAAGTFSDTTNVRIQATQDAALAALFQTTGSAALPTHRAGYEVRINLGSQRPVDQTITATLVIPEALLAAGGGAIVAFVRHVDFNTDDAVDSFDPVDAMVDLAAKTITVTLWSAGFATQPDGSNEAQIILALTPAKRSHQSRVPGSRDPNSYNPDTCDGFTVVNLSLAPFPSPPLRDVPLVITSRIGCREDTNTPQFQQIPNGPFRKPHRGVDLRAKTPIPVLAVADGYVELVKYHSQLPTYNGNYVRIRHKDGTSTEYLHLSAFSSKLQGLSNNQVYPASSGKQVEAGEQIGLSGNTSTNLNLNAHLHFQLRAAPAQNAAYVNPEDFLLGATKDQQELISEFLFRANGQDFATSDELPPLSLEVGKSVSLALKAKDSVFRDVALPADADFVHPISVTPSGVATATITGGEMVIKGEAAGNATIKVEYKSSNQTPNHAWGSVRVKVNAAPTPTPPPSPSPNPTPDPTTGPRLVLGSGQGFPGRVAYSISASVGNVSLVVTDSSPTAEEILIVGENINRLDGVMKFNIHQTDNDYCSAFVSHSFGFDGGNGSDKRHYSLDIKYPGSLAGVGCGDEGTDKDWNTLTVNFTIWIN